MTLKSRDPRSGNAVTFSGSQKGNAYKALISNGTSLYLGTEEGFKWWNVLQYGAIGDGSTNDTSAIQAIITGASAGDVVYFPSGTYLVDSLTMKPGVAIKGAGSRASIMKANANNTKIFTYTASSTQTHFIIEQLGFDSNSKTGCYSIFLDGTDSTKRLSYLRLYDLLISGTFNIGIYLHYCANTYIRDALIISSSIGIEIDVCADTNLEACMVQSGSSYGYYINGGAGAFDEGIRMIGCSTNGQVVGLYIVGQDWGICTGCSFTTCSGGSLITSGSANFWKFTGCEFASATSVGVTLTSSTSGFQFSSCNIGANSFGIILRGARHCFSGGYASGNSNVDIYIDGATQCSIMGNVNHSTGATQSIFEVSPANYNSIIGNINNGTITVVGANSIQANNITY